jgi:hypothetical protein
VTGWLEVDATGTVFAPLVPSSCFSCIVELSTLALCLSCLFACALVLDGPGTSAGVGGVVSVSFIGAADIGNGAGASTGVGPCAGADAGANASTGAGAGAGVGVGFALNTEVAIGTDGSGGGLTCIGVSKELSPALLLFGPSLEFSISAVGAFRLPRAARKLCTKVLR